MSSIKGKMSDWLCYQSLSLILLGAFFWPVGCAKKDAKEMPEIISKSPEVSSYKGIYTLGFEITAFQPCGVTEAWQILPDTIVRNSKFIGVIPKHSLENVAVYVEWKGFLSDSGAFGHMGLCKRRLTVKQIDVAKVYEGECNQNDIH